MNAREIYNMEPESDTSLEDSWYAVGSFIPEVTDNLGDFEGGDRVRIATFKSFSNGGAGWELGGVSFDGEYVMIMQMAGRGYHDFGQTYITNKPLYNRMVAYIRTLYVDNNEHTIIDENEDMKCLTEFYGWDINGNYIA